MSHLNEMRAELQSAGLIVDELVFDNQLRRVPTIAKPKDKSAYYIGFVDGEAVHYGDWRTGLVATCSARTRKVTRADYLKVKKAQEVYKQEQLIKQKRSAEQCRELWLRAKSNNVAEHPYAVKKQITPYNARIDRKNNILIPVLDKPGEISSLQSIDDVGNKSYKAEAKLKGCALMIGLLLEQTTVLVCEGYATGCSLHEATNLPVVVAFNAGNLAAVSKAMAKAHPTIKLVICADNDHQGQRKTGVNVGLDKARMVAEQLNAMLLWPEFEPENDGSDFNDIHCQQGLAALTSMLIPAINGGR